MSIEANQPPRPGGWMNFNTILAAACVLFSAFLFIVIPFEVERPPSLFGDDSAGLDPAFFPNLVAAGFMLAGLWYMRAGRRVTEVNGFRGLTARNYLNIGFTVAVFVIYAAILKPLGFIASSALIVIALSVFYGARHWPSIALVALGVPAVVYLVFRRLLGVSLPEFPDF